MNTREIGRICERRVQDYLKNVGMEITAENYCCREGEIDIVARDGEYIVFVEVKARKNKLFGEPCEAVTRSKQKKIRMAAERYIAEKEYDGAVRFDVAEVIYSAEADAVHIKSINYIKAAFEVD